MPVELYLRQCLDVRERVSLLFCEIAIPGLISSITGPCGRSINKIQLQFTQYLQDFSCNTFLEELGVVGAWQNVNNLFQIRDMPVELYLRQCLDVRERVSLLFCEISIPGLISSITGPCGGSINKFQLQFTQYLEDFSCNTFLEELGVVEAWQNVNNLFQIHNLPVEVYLRQCLDLSERVSLLFCEIAIPGLISSITGPCRRVFNKILVHCTLYLENYFGKHFTRVQTHLPLLRDV